MKVQRYFLLAFSTLQSLFAAAQSFIDTSKIWSIYTCTDFGPCDRRVIELKGDTVIGSTHYTKFIAIQDSDNISAWIPVGAREDVPAKKVYFYNNSAEYLAYDFSLNVNDTFKTDIGACHVEMIVNIIDSITLLTGEKRKRMYFAMDTWIEGIGSTLGPMYPSFYSCFSDLFPELICEFESDTEKYHNSAYEDCFYSFIGIEEAADKTGFSIYPNPVSNQSSVNISYSHSFLGAKISIYDLAGREIIEKILPANTNSYTITLPYIDRGIYIAKLAKDGSDARLKFLVE